ncbi:MAG TPA: hypothetical protein VH475_03555 [Tepidisphaeraceae bacterium]|jgi:hypothetical protein
MPLATQRIIFWIGLLPLLAGAARVQTRDGRTIEADDVAILDNAVDVRGSTQTRVAWDQVTRLVLKPASTPPIEQASGSGALPQGWVSQDIGSVYRTGSAACDADGRFMLTASGWGAWGGRDSLYFAHRMLDGDGQIIAHVSKLDMAHGAVVAGVMMRQSLAPDALMAGACLYPSGQVRLSRRPYGVAPEFKDGDPVPDAAAWVRLARRGDEVSAFQSADGKFWQLVETRKVPIGGRILVGVCAWTTGNSWTGSARIDSVRVVAGTPALTWFADGGPLREGIVLRDGNVVACRVLSMDNSSVRYERGGKELSTPVDRVARLVFSPVPPDLAAPGDRHGVLLSSGDFIEGDVERVARQPVEWPREPQLKATVRSLLFGSRSFEVARDVICVDLAEVAPAAANYEVRTTDGSVIRARTVVLRSGSITVDGAAMADVAEIRKL